MPRLTRNYVSLENALKRLHTRQGSLPTRGTLSTCPGHPDRQDSFFDVNGSCRAIPACRDEIIHEDVAARDKFFRSYCLPV